MIKLIMRLKNEHEVLRLQQHMLNTNQLSVTMRTWIAQDTRIM